MPRRPRTKRVERRTHRRRKPAEPVQVVRVLPHAPLADAQVVNTSARGIALRTRTMLHPGDRLSFHRAARPTVLGEVLASQAQDDGWRLTRCRCLAGGYDTAA